MDPSLKHSNFDRYYKRMKSIRNIQKITRSMKMVPGEWEKPAKGYRKGSLALHEKADSKGLGQEETHTFLFVCPQVEGFVGLFSPRELSSQQLEKLYLPGYVSYTHLPLPTKLEV